MKSVIRFFVLLITTIIVLQIQIAYSQTTLDYLEKQRIERKNNNIKTITTYDSVNDKISSIEYYDENGYLQKKELYVMDLDAGKLCLWQDILITKFSSYGLFSGIESLYERNGSKINYFTFENMKPEILFEIAFDETLIDDVKYIFDNKGNLIEKRFYSEDMYKPDEYEKQILIYDSKNKLVETKYYIPGLSRSSTHKYFYDSSGLLEKVTSVQDETNYVSKYKCEFYNN